MQHKLEYLFGLLAVTVLSVTATAAPVTWTINNATVFSNISYDTATFYGSFNYDADTNTYSNLNIKAEIFVNQGRDDWYHDGDVYILAGPFNVSLPGSATQLNAKHSYPPYGYDTFLTLNFGSALTGAGGTVAITSGTIVGTLDFYSETDESAYLLPGATVSAAVPVPAAVWLFASALAGLGWMRRKHHG